MRDSAALGFSVSILIIASVVAVSVAAWSSPKLLDRLILSPVRVRERGEYYRLLTAGWLHADAGHLFFNMLTLYFFSEHVVRIVGPTRFLILYVSAVVVAHVPTTIRHAKNPRYASLGASGAVAAVTFAAVLLYPGMRLGLLFVPVPIPGILYAIGYLAYSAWQSYRARGGVNHDAHFAGAIYGALLTYAFEPARVVRTIQGYFLG